MAGCLLALLALAACTNQSVVDEKMEETGENILAFSIKGVWLDATGQTQTRVEQIAKPQENEIQTMVLLVYGLNVDENGNDVEAGSACKVFEYRKDWGGEAPGTAVTKLELEQTGTVVTGRMDVSALTQTKLAVRAFVNGMGVRMNGANEVLTPAGMAATPLTTQLEWLSTGNGWKVAWGTRTDVTAKIKTPLPMLGLASIHHTGVNNMDLRLHRQVARFDLRNGRTDLRIGSITPMRACASVEGSGERVDMAPASFLPTGIAPGAEWENVPGEVAPGFYTYPSPRNGEEQLMYFNIAAKVKVGGVWTDRTYKMYLRKDGENIDVRENTRYVINVQEVTDDIITATIRVENWTEGETVDGGIHGNTTDSKKVPAVTLETGNDAANGLTWRVDTSGLPLEGTFATVSDGKYLQFMTPVAKTIVAAGGAGDDQPEVSVDVVSVSGNQKDVWLRHTSEIGTGANSGKMMHKLTVDVSTLTEPTPVGLFVKVKNKAFPEKYVMFMVRGE